MSITIPSGYFATTGAADAIAAMLANLPNYSAASDAAKAVAIAQGSNDIDRGVRFQGRKYDPTQAQEFPRVAYDASKQMTLGLGLGPVGPVGPTGPEVFGLGVQIWDWDYVNGVPIVPAFVLNAVVYQTEWNLTPNATIRQDAIHQGVKGQSLGSRREDYDRKADLPRTGLCRSAYMLLQRYRLASGRII